jgi:hypothetical protein
MGYLNFKWSDMTILSTKIGLIIIIVTKLFNIYLY